VGFQVLAMAPTVPVYDPANDGGFGGPTVGYSDAAINVVANNVLRDDITTTDQYKATGYMEYEVLKGLKYTIRGNMSLSNSDYFYYAPTYSFGYRSLNSTADLSETKGRNVYTVLDHLVSRNFLRVLAVLDQTTLHAVLDVGQLDPAVADRRTAEAMQQPGLFADFRGNFVGIAEQQPFVAAAIADDFNAGIDLGIALDKAANGRAEAGGQTTCRENGDFFGLTHFDLSREVKGKGERRTGKANPQPGQPPNGNGDSAMEQQRNSREVFLPPGIWRPSAAADQVPKSRR